MDALEKQIDTLLRPLGFEAMHRVDGKIYILRANDSHPNYAVYLKSNKSSNGFDYGQCIFDNIASLLDVMLNIAQIFLVSCIKSFDETIIDNPYFGCKNLEEALIRKDLMRGIN